ncbi:hypothetical protein B0H14DRAFT_3500035 [Mycena olivaceomarginata]|nr:hypothetical protein B0H14DRAFT_3500035 [Mycena olivaceomarginata]
MALTPSHPQRGCGFLTLEHALALDVPHPPPPAVQAPRARPTPELSVRGVLSLMPLHSPFASSSFASPFSSPPVPSSFLHPHAPPPEAAPPAHPKRSAAAGRPRPQRPFPLLWHPLPAHRPQALPLARLEFDDGELLSAPSSSRPESPFPDFSLSQGGGGHEQFHSFATYSYSPHGIETVRSPEFGVEVLSPSESEFGFKAGMSGGVMRTRGARFRGRVGGVRVRGVGKRIMHRALRDVTADVIGRDACAFPVRVHLAPCIRHPTSPSLLALFLFVFRAIPIQPYPSCFAFGIGDSVFIPPVHPLIYLASISSSPHRLILLIHLNISLLL